MLKETSESWDTRKLMLRGVHIRTGLLMNPVSEDMFSKLADTDGASQHGCGTDPGIKQTRD